jgi:hypothetical protein
MRVSRRVVLRQALTIGVIGAEIELPYRVLEREPNLEAMRLAIGWAVA